MLIHPSILIHRISSKSEEQCPACSLGGSVAVHVAARKVLPSLAGLVVIDVVEVCICPG